MSKKKKEKRYALVEDNFGNTDEGKERFIGKVAEVIKVERDYLCFSQVRLKFDSGEKEWFCNTTLEEITEEKYLEVKYRNPLCTRKECSCIWKEEAVKTVEDGINISTFKAPCGSCSKAKIGRGQNE